MVFFRISFSYGNVRESELFHRAQMPKIRIVKKQNAKERRTLALAVCVSLWKMGRLIRTKIGDGEYMATTEFAKKYHEKMFPGYHSAFLAAQGGCEYENRQ